MVTRLRSGCGVVYSSQPPERPAWSTADLPGRPDLVGQAGRQKQATQSWRDSNTVSAHGLFRLEPHFAIRVVNKDTIDKSRDSADVHSLLLHHVPAYLA